MTPAFTDGITARALSGRLRLRFVRGEHRTLLAEVERTPPWTIQRLLYLDPRRRDLATVTLLNTTAGLCADDRLRLDVGVAAGAAVELRTPTMTRIFAMPAGEARIETRLVVSAGGYLEYLPEPTLLCRGAALQQRLTLDTEKGAAAAIGGCLVFGRWAHGERHDYRSLQQLLEIRQAGDTLLAEELVLSPAVEPDAPGLVGGYAALGTLTVIAELDDPAGLIAEMRTLMARAPSIMGGASLLPNGAGVAVRVLGETAAAVQTALRATLLLYRARY